MRPGCRALYTRKSSLHRDVTAFSDSKRAAESRRNRGNAGDLWSTGHNHHGACNHGFNLRLQQWFDSGRRSSLLRDGERWTVLQECRLGKHATCSCCCFNCAGNLGCVFDFTENSHCQPANRDLHLWKCLHAITRIHRVGGLDLLRADGRCSDCDEKKAPHIERPYRTFGYPLVPWIYIVLAGLLLWIWPGSRRPLQGLDTCWLPQGFRFTACGEKAKG